MYGIPICPSVLHRFSPQRDQNPFLSVRLRQGSLLTPPKRTRSQAYVSSGLRRQQRSRKGMREALYTVSVRSGQLLPSDPHLFCSRDSIASHYPAFVRGAAGYKFVSMHTLLSYPSNRPCNQRLAAYTTHESVSAFTTKNPAVSPVAPPNSFCIFHR